MLFKMQGSKQSRCINAASSNVSCQVWQSLAICYDETSLAPSGTPPRLLIHILASPTIVFRKLLHEELVHISGCIFSHSSLIDWKSKVDRSRSPKLGKTTAISFPAFLGLLATFIAAAAAAPEEMPTSSPS